MIAPNTGFGAPVIREYQPWSPSAELPDYAAAQGIAPAMDIAPTPPQTATPAAGAPLECEKPDARKSANNGKNPKSKKSDIRKNANRKTSAAKQGTCSGKACCLCLLVLVFLLAAGLCGVLFVFSRRCPEYLPEMINRHIPIGGGSESGPEIQGAVTNADKQVIQQEKPQQQLIQYNDSYQQSYYPDDKYALKPMMKDQSDQQDFNDQSYISPCKKIHVNNDYKNYQKDYQYIISAVHEKVQ